MFCGFFCVSLALGALFGAAPDGSVLRQKQIDAFVAIVDQEMPTALKTDDDRRALRAQLAALAAARAVPAARHPLGLIPFYRPFERDFRRRAAALAGRAAVYFRARDLKRYLEVLGEFYAELGGYPGERVGQSVRTYLADFVYPLLPSVMTGAGLVMLAQPELCGAEPGDLLTKALLGVGAPLVVSNFAVIGTKRGRAWLTSIGDADRDQARGAARIAAHFWATLGHDVGEPVDADHPTGRTWRPSDCERLLNACAGH